MFYVKEPASVFADAKSVGKVAQLIRNLENLSILHTYNSAENLYVGLSNNSSDIMGLNGQAIGFTDGLTALKDFKEVLSSLRAIDPSQKLVINSSSGDMYVTDVTIEVFNLDPNYPDGSLGCRVVLH